VLWKKSAGSGGKFWPTLQANSFKRGGVGLLPSFTVGKKDRSAFEQCEKKHRKEKEKRQFAAAKPERRVSTCPADGKKGEATRALPLFYQSEEKGWGGGGWGRELLTICRPNEEKNETVCGGMKGDGGKKERLTGHVFKVKRKRGGGGIFAGRRSQRK